MTQYYIYIIRCGKSAYYKIGWSECVKARLASLQGGNPFELYVISETPVSNPDDVEKRIHKALASNRIRGEWFELTEAQVLSIPTLIPVQDEAEPYLVYPKTLEEYKAGVRLHVNADRNVPKDFS
jgi:hypothetical protein